MKFWKSQGILNESDFFLFTTYEYEFLFMLRRQKVYEMKHSLRNFKKKKKDYI